MITGVGCVFANAYGNEANGLCRRKTMVLSSGASNASIRAAIVWPIGSRFIQRCSEATQSRASTFSPSWNASPSRRRIVHRSPLFST
jgi:hypothetical protein